MSLTNEQKQRLDSLGRSMEISYAKYSKLYDAYNDHHDPYATVAAYDAAYAVYEEQARQFSQLCFAYGLNYWSELSKYNVGA